MCHNLIYIKINEKSEILGTSKLQNLTNFIQVEVGDVCDPREEDTSITFSADGEILHLAMPVSGDGSQLLQGGYAVVPLTV